ncbi:MAG TPA: hypothetical protein VH062_26990 [Polyangiaceae bacterium]|jgi:hypothetical protein|nr:hypothetical protein [Polyangiaceae bacterium]
MASERVAARKLRQPLAAVVLAFGAAVACGGAALREFPMRPPMARDTDLNPVKLPCHKEPTPKDPKHVSCAPKVYVSPLAWDGIDNSVFRPLARVFAIDPAGEAPNVNSMDEVPDSAWFENRVGAHEIPLESVLKGACTDKQLLAGETVKDGEWTIDQGKSNGATPGFRVKLKEKGKYMLKTDAPVPERPTAAAAIGAAAYFAAGFNTSCEQVIFVKPSSFTLTPGLTVTDNTERTRPFDEKALKKVFDDATHRGEYVRLQASAWLPGYLLGPFRYEKKRDDDPNDIIAHEDRRELRGARLLAAWLNHFDAREQNSMDSWIGVGGDPKKPELDPGFVRHYYLDTSDCLGSEWAWDGISRRLGQSYLLDWGYIAGDFATLGLIKRPWEEVQHHPGMEVFGYFDVDHFDPETWVNEYPNPAFSRMTERDGAWMARILSHFTPEMVQGLTAMGRFQDPARTTYLASVLEGRLKRILARYLTRLSPLTNPRLDGSRLCVTDLARQSGVSTSLRYGAALTPMDGGSPRQLPVSLPFGAEVCVDLPHSDAAINVTAESGTYVIVRIRSSAEGPLDVHLYDLGPNGGFRLAGLERPSP